MSLSKEAISEFKEIYYQEYGERISDEKALLIGEGLLLLFGVIYSPQRSEGSRQTFENQSDRKPKTSSPAPTI